MSERDNFISEQLSVFELAEEQGFLTKRDFEIAGISEEDQENLIELENGFVVQTSERINFEPISEIYPQESLNNDEDDEIKVRTEDGKEFYINHDNSDMYKHHKKSKPIYNGEKKILNETASEKEKYYLKKSTLVKNISGARFRKGYTENESIVKRLLNEAGKWPLEDGMKRYIALSEVRFSFVSNGDRRSMSFNEGEVFLAPQKCEDKEKKKAMTHREQK